MFGGGVDEGVGGWAGGGVRRRDGDRICKSDWRGLVMVFEVGFEVGLKKIHTTFLADFSQISQLCITPRARRMTPGDWWQRQWVLDADLMRSDGATMQSPSSC